MYLFETSQSISILDIFGYSTECLTCNLFSILKIDLDIIDVSNLNRQFLFQKKHVGKSKAQVCIIVKNKNVDGLFIFLYLKVCLY